MGSKLMRLNILNSKEVKKLKEMVIYNFGYFPENDYAYLKNEKKRIFLINKDLVRIDLEKLRIDKVGLYFAEVSETLRLSKEGASFLFREAVKNKIELKNIVELDGRETKAYFAGVDLTKSLDIGNSLILLKYQNDILGCARYKDGKILNFLPKIYRGEVIV